MKIIALLLFTLFAAPQSSNPYCGTSPESFYPIPQFDCPSDGLYIVDSNCAEACADLWQTEMMLAYDAACTSYAAAETEWNAWEATIQSGYEACMAVAQTPQDGVNCYRTMLAQQEANQDLFDLRKQYIEEDLASDVQDAFDSYKDCTSECCILVEDDE
jgi:hypothetical protein